jgi:hypothetical protein
VAQNVGGVPRDNHAIDGFATPADAALASMPAGITHGVETRVKPGGDMAYVLLAIEVAGTGYYLDENILQREPDGTWTGDSSGGGGFTDRTLDDLRAAPPRQGMFDSLDPTPWPRAP